MSIAAFSSTWILLRRPHGSLMLSIFTTYSRMLLSSWWVIRSSFEFSLNPWKTGSAQGFKFDQFAVRSLHQPFCRHGIVIDYERPELNGPDLQAKKTTGKTLAYRPFQVLLSNQASLLV
jgi:hypothetical protein